MVLKDEQSRQALIDENFQAALDQLEQKILPRSQNSLKKSRML